MNNPTRFPGKTTIAPDVLISIARLTTLGVSGVSQIATMPAEVNRLFKKGGSQGVRIEIENNTVNADLYVILKHDVNVREVCRNIQSQVARAISEMVGMEVGKVNVHVEDIDYTAEVES